MCSLHVALCDISHNFRLNEQVMCHTDDQGIRTGEDSGHKSAASSVLTNLCHSTGETIVDKAGMRQRAVGAAGA
jgi:hypothetical protein